MKKTLILVAASVCLFAASSAHAQGDLVLNGGFETGDLTSWVNVFPTHPVAVVAGNAHSGTYALQMVSPPPNGGSSEVYQNLTLAAVPTVVDFWAETTGNGTFSVFLDSQLVRFGSIPGATGYTEYTYTVTPTAGVGELNFEWTSANTLYLDDVSVTPVPEPTTMMMTTIGGALLLPVTLRMLRKTRTA
jgi:hypothetical protein